MKRRNKAAAGRKRWVVRVVAGAGLFVAAITANAAHAADPPNPYEQVQQAHAAIMRGDYATAGQIGQSVLNNSRVGRWHFYPFAMFITLAGGVSDPAFGTHLGEWVKQDPPNPIALLISAEYKLHQAWLVRGTDSSLKTERSRMVSFQDYSADALGDVERSIERDSHDPYAYYMKLQILAGFGLHKDLPPQFKAAIAHFPAYYSLYKSFLGTLRPRWSGSIDAMYAFVDQYAGKAPKNSPLKLLYVQLYRDLLDDASMMCHASSLKGNRELERRCIDLTLEERLVRPGLEDNLKGAFALNDGGDRNEFEEAIFPLLYGIAATPDGDIAAEKVIQMAADALHVETKLEPSNPGHNDYAIDMAMSEYWRQKGDADNAVKKATEALLDIENTRFPSAIQRNVILAAIHEQMAKIYSDVGRTAEMINAEKAAMNLGVPLVHPQLVCVGYYGRKDYPRAIEACSQIIADDPDNVEARLWRGHAYSFSKMHSEARADLTVEQSSTLWRGDEHRHDTARRQGLSRRGGNDREIPVPARSPTERRKASLAGLHESLLRRVADERLATRAR